MHKLNQKLKGAQATFSQDNQLWKQAPKQDLTFWKFREYNIYNH